MHDLERALRKLFNEVEHCTLQLQVTVYSFSVIFEIRNKTL